MAKRTYDRKGLVRWLDDKGNFHREDGPAEVYADDSRLWWRHGDFHFAHGPSDVYADGTLEWYEDNTWLREREPYG